MGSHLRRHGEGAGIGIGAGVGPHPQEIVVEGHHRVFQKHRHRPEKEILREADIAGKGGLQFLAVDVELHIVPHLGDDFRKSVIPQGRVDAGTDGGNEVPHRFRGEPASQIDGHRQGHRAFLVGMLPALLFQQHVDQRGGEVLCDGGVITPCGLPELLQGHEAHGDMEGVKRLRGAGVGIGLRHPPQTQGVPPGIAGVSVLQLLLPGRFLQVQHAVSGRNAYAGLPQILRQQRPEKDQGPGPVGQGVEHLQRDAVPVVVKPHQPAVVLPEAHRLAGIGHVGLQKGARGGVGLQIVPE